MGIALADYNEKARRDREKSAAKPFVAGGEMGGGTLAARVAGQIAANRAASESSEIEEAISPTDANSDGEGGEASNANTGGSAFDDEGPSWPSEADEAAFLAQTSGSASSEPGTRAEADDDDTSATKELPTLDSLVERIPTEARTALEELFRARFVKVRKMPKKALKE